ncbi:MAG: hypothetical protein AAFW89_00195 [Bacteroidota bacterium]
MNRTVIWVLICCVGVITFSCFSIVSEQDEAIDTEAIITFTFGIEADGCADGVYAELNGQVYGVARRDIYEVFGFSTDEEFYDQRNTLFNHDFLARVTVKAPDGTLLCGWGNQIDRASLISVSIIDTVSHNQQ